jgi:hypothetical protein
MGHIHRFNTIVHPLCIILLQHRRIPIFKKKEDGDGRCERIIRNLFK